MSYKLKLSKFNPLILEKKRRNGHAPIMLFVGKRGSGKSTLVEDILYHMKGIRAFMCMSGTEEGNGFYGKHIHPLCIHNSFNESALADLLKHQKEQVIKLKKAEKDPKDHPEIGVGVLMDDLTYDRKMMKDQSMREIFFNGRHYHITTMITTQYLMDIPPSFRANVDYVFVCKQTQKSEIEKLYKYFFGIFDKSADFKSVLAASTNDFMALVLDNTSRSNRIEDQVFWYKAKLGRKFKIGTAEMWKHFDMLLMEQEKDDESDDDFTPEKPKSSIQIERIGPNNVDIQLNSDDEFL